jgi:hypothetical protein
MDTQVKRASFTERVKKLKHSINDSLRRHRLFVFGAIFGFGLAMLTVYAFEHKGNPLWLAGWILCFLGGLLYRLRNDLK